MVARRLRDKQERGELITIEIFVIDTIKGVIARIISKSDDREALGRFEITSTITS